MSKSNFIESLKGLAQTKIDNRNVLEDLEGILDESELTDDDNQDIDSVDDVMGDLISLIADLSNDKDSLEDELEDLQE